MAWLRKAEPPVRLLSLNFGCTPNISAINRPDSGFELPGSEPNTASTWRVVKPASAKALTLASMAMSSEVRPGASPMPANATPTMAALPRML